MPHANAACRPELYGALLPLLAPLEQEELLYLLRRFSKDNGEEDNNGGAPPPPPATPVTGKAWPASG